MTITASGYSGGPMTELQWSQTAGGLTFESDTDCKVTQPATTAPSVSVAPGSCSAFGVRVTNDAALAQALTQPGTGGAWYLLAWRRTWSPTKTAVLQVLGGPTTAGTTAPATTPNTLPASFVNTPGVQHDQPIAWVWVSSANTTLTIFDVRLIRTLTGSVRCLSFPALGMAGQLLPDGATVALGTFNTLGGGRHYRSPWQRVSGALQPIGVILADDTNAGATTVRVDLLNECYSRGSIGINDGTTEVLDSKSRIRYRWDGTAGAWKAWESPWFTYNFGVTNGFAGGWNASNGWLNSGGQMRYRGGKVGFRGTVIVNGNGAVNGQINLGLPVAADPNSPSQVVGGIEAYHGSGAANLTDFPLWGFVNGSTCYTGAPNIAANNAAASAMTGPTTPFTWVQSDQLRFNFEYDPA